MPPVGKVGVSLAGGIITGPGGTGVFVEGVPICVVGDAVTPHGTGPHSAATMASGSVMVFVAGIPICKEGDLATCGDALTNGAASVMVNA